jgi:drug/metabolite transporter (DMT)-like permease
MCSAPLFFSTNLVFGRSLADEMDPFVLAFIRWLLVAIFLSPFVIREREKAKHLITTHWRLLLILGFLGMWVSGAIVYLALQHTTAINGALIYTTSPVIILMIEALFSGRRIGGREILGATVAFFGVALIVLRGNLAALIALEFNVGDVLIGLAAVSWAIYSVLYRKPVLKNLSNLALFGIIAWAGSITLLPAVLFVCIDSRLVLPGSDTFLRIAGLVFFASIAAFGLFQYGVRSFGPSLSGLFMYLMPVYGMGLALFFLGETMETFHIYGTAAVLAGIILATFPVGLLKRQPNFPSAGKVSNSQNETL